MNKTLGRLLIASAALAALPALAGATFFDGQQFVGQPLRIDGVAPDFRAFDYNDRAVSMIVEGSPVEVCMDINFSGNCQVFNPGQYPTLGVWGSQISSVRPVRGGSELGMYKGNEGYQDGYYRDGRDGYGRDGYGRDGYYRDGYPHQGADPRESRSRYRYRGY